VCSDYTHIPREKTPSPKGTNAQGTRDRELSRMLIPAIIQGASGGTRGVTCWDNTVNVSFCNGDL